MTDRSSSINKYLRIMRYLEQATDTELMEFIEAVQQRLQPQSFFQERERAYKDWRATHAERYAKVQRMFPDRLRRTCGRPHK